MLIFSTPVLVATGLGNIARTSIPPGAVTATRVANTFSAKDIGCTQVNIMMVIPPIPNSTNKNLSGDLSLIAVAPSFPLLYTPESSPLINTK